MKTTWGNCNTIMEQWPEDNDNWWHNYPKTEISFANSLSIYLVSTHFNSVSPFANGANALIACTQAILCKLAVITKFNFANSKDMQQTINGGEQTRNGKSLPVCMCSLCKVCYCLNGRCESMLHIKRLFCFISFRWIKRSKLQRERARETRQKKWNQNFSICIWICPLEVECTRANGSQQKKIQMTTTTEKKNKWCSTSAKLFIKRAKLSQSPGKWVSV